MQRQVSFEVETRRESLPGAYWKVFPYTLQRQKYFDEVKCRTQLCFWGEWGTNQMQNEDAYDSQGQILEIDLEDDWGSTQNVVYIFIYV